MISKKLAFIIIFVLFLLSSVTSYSIFSNKVSQVTLPTLGYKPPKQENGKADQSLNEPKTEECPLNGALYGVSQKEKWEKRRPLGIMIENHTQARPQSGLASADIVYEIVAEGGITRFLSIFYCQDAAYVGPVRSARIYFIKLLEGYGNNPLYAHVGGANTPGPADALGYIKDIEWNSYNDMNQFSVPFPYFWRDYERLPNRVTEHTVYSSTTKLWQYAKDKRKLTNVDEDGVSWDKNFSSWKFKDEAKPELRGTATKTDFGFWDNLASDFSVEWVYSKTANNYSRNNGGAPHLDKNTGKPISAKNVVIMFAKESPANDGYEGGHLLYKVVGSGDALVFQDGKVLKAIWKREDEKDQVKFFNQNGEEIPMVRGQVWVEILPTGNKVTY